MLAMSISPISQHSAIKEWLVASNTVITLVSSGLTNPYGVAVDGVGQCLYRRHRQQRDQGMGGGQQHCHHAGVFGIDYPYGVAVDGVGNVYHRRHRQQRDQGMGGGQQHRHHAGVFGIEQSLWRGGGWLRAMSISPTPETTPIKEWVAASNTVITLVSSGLSSPRGVAVDGSGNVYIADTGDNAIKEWNGSQQHRHHAGVFGIFK